MNDLGIRSGDILLYHCHDIDSRLIQFATHGPYNHCSIAINEHQMIESVGKYGVIKSSIYKPNLIIPMNGNIPSENVSKGITFLQRHIGDAYGVLDIVLDAFLAFAPKRLSDTPVLIAPSAFSCSHLTVAFLLVAGIKIPDKWVLNPSSVSPNDIFRYFTNK